MKHNFLFKFILFIFTLCALWIGRDSIAALWSWISDRETVTASMERLGMWGPIVLCILFVLQVFLAFIPGQALMVACGYLYGFWGGFLLSWLSLVLGGEAAFALARRYGRVFADRWISPNVLARWDKSAAGQGVGFFTLSLVMPLIPNDAMCYVAGLGKISHRRFSLANFMGRGIACVVMSWIGAFGTHAPSYIWIVVIAISACIVGWVIYKKTAVLPTQKYLANTVGSLIVGTYRIVFQLKYAVKGFMPLVAIQTSSIPKIVYDGANGYLTKAGDAYAMGQSMIKILNDPCMAASMGRVSRTLAEGHPNQETFDEHERLYDQMLREQGTQKIPAGVKSIFQWKHFKERLIWVFMSHF